MVHRSWVHKHLELHAHIYQRSYARSNLHSEFSNLVIVVNIFNVLSSQESPLFSRWRPSASALVTLCPRSRTPLPWIGSSPCVSLLFSPLSSSLRLWTTSPTFKQREQRENRPKPPPPPQPVPRAPHRQAKEKTQRRFYRWDDVTHITKTTYTL